MSYANVLTRCAVALTSDDLDALRSLVNSNLTLAAKIERLAAVNERLAHDVYDLKQQRELDKDQQDMRMREIDKKLALIDREVTSPRLLVPPPQEPEPAVVKVIAAFERLPVSTKIIIAVLVVILTASGWIRHLLQ